MRRPIIGVVGGGTRHVPDGSPVFEQAFEVGQAIARAGAVVLCGGGGGVMLNERAARLRQPVADARRHALQEGVARGVRQDHRAEQPGPARVADRLEVRPVISGGAA